MQTEKTFTDAGWNFTTPVWAIVEGVDYPRLWWEMVPAMYAEPEITLGTTNTIFWKPVPGDFEYYAECSEDANFTSIIYNSGWITETSCEFIGLQLGKRYWYSVKARNAVGIESPWSNVESSLQSTLTDAVDIMLAPEILKNKNMKNALLNKIDEVLGMINEGLYADALDKLEYDILAKMNGCADSGESDKTDWIITCDQQNVVYPLVVETIEYVKSLIE
jgi:predicted phage tail protein